MVMVVEGGGVNVCVWGGGGVKRGCIESKH